MSEWRKSSYSSSGGQCVEVAEAPEVIRIRDTQHREHGHLSFPVAEWRAFLADVRAENL